MADDKKRPAVRAKDAADDDQDEPVDQEALLEFLELKSTMDRIYEVVEATVLPGAPANVIDDIVQTAYENALEAKSRPRATAGVLPWISRVARNATFDFFRENAVDERWLDLRVQREDVAAPTQPEDESPGPDPRMIEPWLRQRVAHHARDRETFEIMCEGTRRPYARIAAERAMTVDALTKRVQHFRAKHLPAVLAKRGRERERTRFFFLLFGGAALVLAVVLWLVLG